MWWWLLNYKYTKESYDNKKSLNISLGPKLGNKFSNMKKYIGKSLDAMVCVEIKQGHSKHVLVNVIFKHFVVLYCLSNVLHHYAIILMHLFAPVYLVFFLYVLWDEFNSKKVFLCRI